MNEISISSYRLIQDTNKPYYVYNVEVSLDDLGLRRTIEKRYSAFHSLHRELRKQFTTPPFPPKRVRCSQLKVLEQRRQGLERYLQIMFRFAPSRAHVISFLGIQTSTNYGIAGRERNIDHQPVYRIVSLNENQRSSLPNIITKGVLDALYGID